MNYYLYNKKIEAKSQLMTFICAYIMASKKVTVFYDHHGDHADYSSSLSKQFLMFFNKKI